MNYTNPLLGTAKALNIYNAFYSNATNLGVGQAKAVIFFVLVVSISLTQLYFTRRREVQL